MVQAGPVAKTTFSLGGLQMYCPICGGVASVASGTYQLTGELLELVRGASLTSPELQLLRSFLQQVQAGTGIADVTATAARSSPQVAAILKALGTNVIAPTAAALLAALLLHALGLGEGGDTVVHNEHITIVQNGLSPESAQPEDDSKGARQQQAPDPVQSETPTEPDEANDDHGLPERRSASHSHHGDSSAEPRSADPGQIMPSDPTGGGGVDP